jgi:hypothetical protein
MVSVFAAFIFADITLDFAHFGAKSRCLLKSGRIFRI